MVLLKSNASQMPTQPSTTMETENHSHILLGNLPVILSELLLTFARNKGKMQIINQKVSDDNYDHYCQFTADDGTITRVNFSNSTKSLTAQDISKQKFLLAVNTLADGSYCLDYIEDKKE